MVMPCVAPWQPGGKHCPQLFSALGLPPEVVAWPLSPGGPLKGQGLDCWGTGDGTAPLNISPPYTGLAVAVLGGLSPFTTGQIQQSSVVGPSWGEELPVERAACFLSRTATFCERVASLFYCFNLRDPEKR